MAGRTTRIPVSRAAIALLGLLSSSLAPLPAFSQAIPPTEYFLGNDAAGSYVSSWQWFVTKSVTTPAIVYAMSGATVPFGFQVAVTHSPSPMATQAAVSGNIFVQNFGSPVAFMDLTDKLLPPFSATCGVWDQGGNPASGVIVPNFFIEAFSFRCDLPDGPLAAELGLNESTGTFTPLDPSSPPLSTSVLVSFGWSSSGETDACVIVSDPAPAGMEFPANAFLLPDQELCVGENGVYGYTASVQVVPGCVEYTSGVSIVATDSQTARQSIAKVRACGITGARGVGYWQNKNGQAEISRAPLEADGQTCALVGYLSGFAPFQDILQLNSKSCSKVAAWAAGVIKSGNARSTMQGGLKAQMLATALDVFFSTTALGELDVDLARVCNQSTCASPTDPQPNGFVAAMSAFGDAAHMKVKDLLAFAAGRLVNGSWYGDVKALQELAKDTFAAINGERAFAWRP
jgi:hypothetical protein